MTLSERELQRWWPRFVDVAALVWLGLFAVDIANGRSVLTLSQPTETALNWALLTLLFVFLLDIVLLFRWSREPPGAFVQSNWLWILTVIPWFRPFRLLRAGRGLRTLRILIRSRRVGSLLNKLRRLWRRVWQRLLG